MGHQYIEKLNPAIKFIGSILFILILIMSNSLIINGYGLLLMGVYFVFKTNIDQSIKRQTFVNAILILIGCGFISVAFSLVLQSEVIFMLWEFDLSFLYYALKYGLLIINIILVCQMFIYTSDAYKLIIALSSNFYLPFKATYFIFTLFMLIQNFDNEYEIVLNMYALRGIYAKKFSIKTFKTLMKTYPKRIKEQYIALLSKGYNKEEVNFYFKPIIGSGEIFYMLSIVFAFGIKIVLIYRGVNL